MQTTPASLLERLRQPEAEAAWERFVHLYTPLLCMWSRRLGLEGSDVEDLVQDTFALLARKLPEFQYQPDKRFRGWLWTVLLNKVRAQRRGRVPVQPMAAEDLPPVVVPDIAEEIEEAEYRRYLIQRALQLMEAEFAPTTWKAFHACVADDRPAQEVAAELGLTVTAVYAAKSRVLRRLREELHGLLD